MRWLKLAVVVVLLLAVAGAGTAVYVWRRALPAPSGTARVAGVGAAVEIVRDRWGIPHIFAETDRDAYFALGWVMAQDRLFQMDLVRHVSQGRLAELLGAPGVEVDTLFRTVGLRGIGLRMYDQARPEVRAALAAFAEGANAWLAELDGALPPEYALLRTAPQPFRADDFASVVGFMTWRLNPGWRLDPVYERLVAKVGPRRAAALFPQRQRGPLPLAQRGARAPAFDGPIGAAARPAPSAARRDAAGAPRPPEPTRLQLSAWAEALLAGLPGLHGSNSFAVGPQRSATGGALLANDPHLGLGLPGTWYQAHLRTPQHEVLGAFVPGVPFAVIGHNRDIAWGFVNLNLDASDFFVERLDPARPGQVQYRGRWVPLRTRVETIHVKGGEPVALTVRSTPHGPLVHDLLEGQAQALSFRWVYAAATDANEINGFHDLNRARNWDGFRAALRQFGAVAQHVTYADRRGNIGVQASGRVPRRVGRRAGLRYRAGWTGTEEWHGFWPFARNPSLRNPADGVVLAANHPPARPPPFYLSAYYEPEDRLLRLRELLAARGRHAPEHLQRIQRDTLFVTGRALAPQVVAAFAEAPPAEPTVRAALRLLRDWDGGMAMTSGGAAVFAAFYAHLFPAIFADELGTELLEALRGQTNQPAVMIHAVLKGGLTRWLDRVDTPAREDRAAVFRMALREGVAELVRRLGDDPADWEWGALHRVRFRHPLGRVAALAPLFNVGPLPLPGHSLTVNKAQFKDGDYDVYMGPSLRHVTDMGAPADARGVLPGGQSGIPASPHYDDLIPLWRQGRYHPLLMERAEIDRLAEGRWVLRPAG